MKKPKILSSQERLRLLDELQKRYEGSVNFKQRIIYNRKRYTWIIVVEGAKLLKRCIDFVFSLILLILFSPLFLIISLLIKLQDGGPVFYVTNRVGKWGKEFAFPKFRSMRVDAEKMQEELTVFSKHKGGKIFKIQDDPRVTTLGRWLRKSSLDELPQLWCILKGEMSLVGPRPPLPKEVALYSLEERRRLEVIPGLTGIWQVSGRSEIPFEKQVQLDLQYIESQNFWLDFKILLKTIPAVIFGKGAY